MLDKETGYFNWLIEKVNGTNHYSKLLSYLYFTDFIVILEDDENRAADGIDLRRWYADETGCTDFINSQKPCSVLELLISVAIRIEDTMMVAEKNNQTPKWFWNMIANLEMRIFNNERFDENAVSRILDRFMNRQYCANGKGGLFTIDGLECDLNTVPLWYQICWYMNNLIKY